MKLSKKLRHTLVVVLFWLWAICLCFSVIFASYTSYALIAIGIAVVAMICEAYLTRAR